MLGVCRCKLFGKGSRMVSKSAMALLGVLLGVMLVAGTFKRNAATGAAANPVMAAACEGGALRTAQARNQAMEDGYDINRQYDCIDKASFQTAQAQKKAWQDAQGAQADQARADQAAKAPLTSQTLAQARQGFVTQVAYLDERPLPLPNPPASEFVRMDYTGSNGKKLPAFVTPASRDGKRYPAILWLTGGDTHSLDNFWTPGPPANDQTASAFRRAGVVMMFPVLRGGNAAGGHKQFFYGEVDDVLAAAQALARLPQVDPAHVYLGGHSTGGTLALLAAAAGGDFRAIFALGPAADVRDYGPSVIPIDFRQLPPQEAKLRSPVRWLHGITRPTYLMEGKDNGNTDSLRELCAAAATNPQVHCLEAAGYNHFSLVDAAARRIAARMVQAHMGGEFVLNPDVFDRN